MHVKCTGAHTSVPVLCVWGLRVCFSNRLSGNTDAAIGDHTGLWLKDQKVGLCSGLRHLRDSTTGSVWATMERHCGYQRVRRVLLTLDATKLL